MNLINTKSLSLVIAFFMSVIFFNNAHAVNPEVGQTYYTKHGLFYEKGRHITTNYGRGEFLPANSQVQVKSIKGKRMVIVHKGQNITIENVAKHSKADINEIGDRLLSTSQVSMSGQYAKDMRLGVLRLGMTKAEVIKTRGYPPAHKTPHTDLDLWVYWSSRFVQLSLAFNNGRLTKGRGLR